MLSVTEEGGVDSGSPVEVDGSVRSVGSGEVRGGSGGRSGVGKVSSGECRRLGDVTGGHASGLSEEGGGGDTGARCHRVSSS